MAETPNDSDASTPNARFMSQAATVEDRLKADTVGLVTLNDFRKRRAEALEAGVSTPGSGATTPDGRESTPKAAFKKRKKGGVKKGGLSFGDDEAEDDSAAISQPTKDITQSTATPDASTPATDAEDASFTTTAFKKKPLRPNASVGYQPKAMTKSALLKEAHLKDALRREYVQIQEAVKATEFVLPFVFYDGKNVPGGMVRLKKGDPIWLFLERARKVGAELGRGDRGRKDWARISVDDLMVVRGDMIIPHHYDFHHFLLNRAKGYAGEIFSFSSDPTSATPKELLPSKSASAKPTPETPAEDATAHLQTAAQRKQQAALQTTLPDSELEGFDHDPNATKVVDRRWYERSKHIYPMSSWEEFDPERGEEYRKGVRKDQGGNTMFFSR